MSWHVPSLWAFALLTVAAFRITRLIAYDNVTAGLRERVTHRVEFDAGSGTRYRPWLDELLGCAFCVSFWVCMVGWLAWLAWPHAVVVLAVPWAASAVVGLVAHNLDS